MALETRSEYFGAKTSLVLSEISRTSRLVSKLTGMVVPGNKAIVGANAFAHESGIHQDGMLKEKTTYEIMTPETIGLKESKLVLGKHSGRHAFRDKLSDLGYDLPEDELNAAFSRFKDLADKKKKYPTRIFWRCLRQDWSIHRKSTACAPCMSLTAMKQRLPRS